MECRTISRKKKKSIPVGLGPTEKARKEMGAVCLTLVDALFRIIKLIARFRAVTGSTFFAKQHETEISMEIEGIFFAMLNIFCVKAMNERTEEDLGDMKVKSIAWVLCLLLLLGVTGLLAGCGGDKEKKEVPAVAPAKPAAQEESIQSIFGKAKQVPGVTYDSVTTMKEMTVTSTIWAEKEKVKMEQTIQGRKSVMYFDGNDMYQYDPASNTAMKFPTKGMDRKGLEKPDPSGYSDHMAPNSLKIIENVVYEGVKCRVISYNMKDGDAAVKMWVREDFGMPMRMEMTMKDGTKITTENKNMKIGALSPDTFKLPVGAKIQDMSELMKKIPPKP